LITTARARSICRKVMEIGGKRKLEVLLSAEDGGLTRFANNAIHQNVSASDTSVSIRAMRGKKSARVNTNRLDSESLKEVVERAFDLAKIQEPNPDALPLPAAQRYRSVRSYFKATAAFGPAERAAAVRKAVTVCKKRGASAAGAFSTQANLVAVANTRGLFAAGRATVSSLSLTAELDDGAGWAEAVATDVSRIDPALVASRAASRAQASRKAKRSEPGKYTVILEPAAVGDLVLMLGYYSDGFNAMAYVEKRSPFSGKLGRRVLGANFTLTEDPFHRLLPGRGFDLEGMPRKRVPLIEKGVLKGLVHDRVTAKKMKTRSTGHAGLQPAPNGPSVSSLVLEPGKATLEDMVQRSERAILVTHFHYTNMVDLSRLVATGMTRDGTFLIENGKVTHPIRNMRFTQSLTEAFSNILDVGREPVLCEGFFGGGVVTPAMRMKDFTFSSKTEF